MPNNQSPIDAPEWRALTAHAAATKDTRIQDLFAENDSRFDGFHETLGDLTFDYSKHKITKETLSLLMALAKAQDIEAARDDMLSGAVINHTENRSVLHTALRTPVDETLEIRGENINEFTKTLRAQIKDISATIRANTKISDIIHIGVGGSYLGTRTVCEALQNDHDGPKIHFLCNIDGQTISKLLGTLDPETTLITIASKTFETFETMACANAVKQWLIDELGGGNAQSHLYAMTANQDKAAAFGVPVSQILPMRTWIGGRYSTWSSVGLPIAIACGYDVFEEFLAGASIADQHFTNTPLEKNIPVIMAMIGIWNRNFQNCASHAILPYADAMSLFPTYMQQIDMESNGKTAAVATSPVIFGAAGTGAQHAFMQAFHQGSDIIPSDFIVPIKNKNADAKMQKSLVANALAQSQALMRGAANQDQPHRHFEGNRPSSTFLIPQVDAQNIGTLIALYEHKIFVQGTVWDINSFDQWGVELGKELAKDVIADLNAGQCSASHDSSTAGLIHAILKD